ncbi:HAD-IIB family hydrolase [Myceligenerans crystallogenes]|uniref:HAD family hydrolase n=1 Tax=Myceligenerans crystallogenes TaxID=316335 RepID=A0ABP4ZVW8_9MICO
MVTFSQGYASKRPTRIVFLDVDGTLIRKGSAVVPERTRAAVWAVRERGIKVVLATGRPLHNVVPIAEQLELTREGGWVIADNGAITAQLTGRRLRPVHVVRRSPFNPLGAFMVAMATYPEVIMAVEDLGKGWRVNSPLDNKHLSGRVRTVPEKKLWEYDVTRAAVRAPGIAGLVPRIEGAGFTAYADGPNHVDITAPGVSKFAEAAWLCNEWRINLVDAAAAGDGLNDCGLLRSVGWGCAMTGAPQEVLDVANCFTGSAEQEGIVMFLDSLVPSETVTPVLPTRTTAGAR